jgi:hypothetical protein
MKIELLSLVISKREFEGFHVPFEQSHAFYSFETSALAAKVTQ